MKPRSSSSWRKSSKPPSPEKRPSLILPGLGSILGAIGGYELGAEVGNLLDRITGGFFTRIFGGGSVWQYQFQHIDQQTGRLVSLPDEDHAKNTNADLRAGTYSLTGATMVRFNQVIAALGVTVDPASLPTPAFVSWVNSGKPWGHDTYAMNFGSSDSQYVYAGDATALVRAGIEWNLSKVVVNGGNPLKGRVFEAWRQTLVRPESGNDLLALMTDLQVADEVARYQQNTGLFNGLTAIPGETTACHCRKNGVNLYQLRFCKCAPERWP